MAAAPMEERIIAHVDAFLRGRASLEDYLAVVEPGLRDEVRATIRETRFINDFFARLAPPGRMGPRPQRVADCELGERLGGGAMGDVYRARQDGLEREVAVKLVRIEVAHRADFLSRFRREARTLARLDHPGIVKVLSCGQHDGWHYFVMELVEGRDLAAAHDDMRRALVAGGSAAGAAFERIALIVAELLDAIAYAHGRGVVHRDLKPSNVMLDTRDRPRVVDFGLAWADAEDDGVRTQRGALLGTPAYLPPEVARNEALRPVDLDLWAAGVMLYELITGRRPYSGDRAESVLTALRNPRWIDVRAECAAAPRPLAAICRTALAPSAADRYRTAQAFAADLRTFLAGEPVLADRRWRVRVLLGHLRRNARRYVVVAMVVATAFVTWWVTDAAAAARVLEADARELLASAPADRDDLDVLRLFVDRARGLLARDGLQSAQREALERELAAAERVASAALARGIAEVQAGAGSAVPPRVASPVRQMFGVRTAVAATAILGRTAPGPELLAHGYPTLVVANPVGRSTTPVRIVAIDPARGEPVLTVVDARTPFSQNVPPGSYRIIVGDAQAFAEYERTLVVPGAVEIVPRLVATGVASAGMIAIPAGSATVGMTRPAGPVYGIEQVTHAAFLIDRTEVTCADYYAFCLDTRRSLPSTWNGAYDPTWHAKPVVGVGHAEAVAYAEWCGKRLPNWIEWQVAARGRNGDSWPWGPDASPLATLPTVGRREKHPWFDGVRAVGTTSQDTSWCGVVDMLGNVIEWTSTTFVSHLDGVPIPVVSWRVRGGLSWYMNADEHCVLDIPAPGPPESELTGFRCAKSLAP